MSTEAFIATRRDISELSQVMLAMERRLTIRLAPAPSSAATSARARGSTRSAK
jgi:hypothetical protein